MRAEEAATQAGGMRDGVSAAPAAKFAAAGLELQAVCEVLGPSEAAPVQAASTSSTFSKVANGSIATQSASTANGVNKRKACEEPMQTGVPVKTRKVGRRSMPAVQDNGHSKRMVSRTAT